MLEETDEMEEKEAELLREPSATFGGEGEAQELHEEEMFSEFVGSCRISTIESLNELSHECCCISYSVSNSSVHLEQYDSETISNAHQVNLTERLIWIFFVFQNEICNLFL